MTLWIHRDGEFISTSTNGAWKADGTRRGILPPPRPTKILNTTYDSQVSDAVIPYRTLRGNQVILDSARLYGPNGTRASIVWSGHRRTLASDGMIGAAFRMDPMTATEKAARINGALNTITAVVTDSQGGQSTYTQQVLATGVNLDPFYDSKLTGDGRWLYLPYPDAAAFTRTLQIAVDLPTADRAIVEVEQFDGPPVTLSQTRWVVDNPVHPQRCYCSFTVNIPAGLPNMTLLRFRAKTWVPSRPELGMGWGCEYYMQLVTRCTPTEKQTLPDIYPAAHWCHLKASRIPLATVNDGWQEVTDGLTVTPQDSTTYVNELFRQRNYFGMTTDKYAPSIYLVDANTPRVKVYWEDTQGYGFDDDHQGRWDSVPVPPDALPSNGTDGHIAFYAQDTDQWWEFWQFHREGARYVAVTGGRVDAFSTKQGQNKAHRNEWPCFTVSASGLALMPTVLKVPEVLAALRDYDPADESKWDNHINHVLACGLPQAKKYGICWPATSTDGTHNDVAAPWQGQRFSIDPTLNLKTLGLTPGEHIMARAAQLYGMMTTETAGSVSVGCQSAHAWRLGQSPQGTASPYDGLFGGTGKQWDMFSKIPKSTWRAHRIFKDQADFEAHLLPA